MLKIRKGPGQTNTSLRKGYLPRILKGAAIIPLQLTLLERISDQPTSLTCQTAKVMEGFTFSNVLPQLDKKQFAVAGKTLEQAIVYFLHLAIEGLDKICSVIFFFADFVKGFDLTSNRILLV